MYATAHLVRSGKGAEGVNSFLHLHGARFQWPEDASTLPESNPGKIVAAKTNILPGGNSVRAYLDLLGPDQVQAAEIEQAIVALGKDLAERRNPTVFRHGCVTIRFGTEAGLDSMRDEYLSLLRKAAMKLFVANESVASDKRNR